jgi:hypothetical protein
MIFGDYEKIGGFVATCQRIHLYHQLASLGDAIRYIRPYLEGQTGGLKAWTGH